MTTQPNERDDAFLAGYLRGVEVGTRDGHAAGYAEGVAVLDDAANALAELRPSVAVAWAGARARRGVYETPARSAEEIRIEAARSWGLPTPADLADDATSVPVPTQDHLGSTADELSDEDDWAWSG